VHESASSSPLTPGLSSPLFIDLTPTNLSSSTNVLSPNPLQIKILPVTSPAAIILWFGWNARTVIFFVWCSVIFLTTARSDSVVGTFHIWSLHLNRIPKYFPEALTVIISGCFVCTKCNHNFNTNIPLIWIKVALFNNLRALHFFKISIGCQWN